MPPDNPLNADEYAPGRRVRLGDSEVDVRDEIRGQSGSTYLVVGAPDNDVCALLPAAIVRDEGEAIDPEQVQQEREDAAAADAAEPTPAETTSSPDVAPTDVEERRGATPATPPPPGGTDGPRGTGAGV